MALRPVLITGVTLASVGALVAGTPALFVPRDEITVAASATEAPAHKTLTQEQINLLAFSLDGAWAAYREGYGAQYYQGTVPVAAFVKVGEGEDAQYDDITADTDPSAAIYDSNGDQLFNVDTAGNVTPATALDVQDGVSDFYYKNEDGTVSQAEVTDPGNCSATGAVCKDGISGLLYYASDNLLPFLGPVDNIYFEGGLSDFAYIATSVAASIVDEFDPTQRLQLSKRVDEYFSGGLSQVAYSVINDNLPDDAIGTWAKGLNDTYFSAGISGVVSYIVDTVTALTSATQTPDTTETTQKSAALRLLSAEEGTEATTETESGSVSSPTVPGVSKLLSLSTANIESAFKNFPKLESPFKAPASSLAATLDVKDEGTVDKVVKDDTETTTPATDVSRSEEAQTPKAPKFELPKLPKLSLPEIKAPQSNIETTKVETKADTDTEKTETEASTPEAPESEAPKSETAKSETGKAATSKPEKGSSLVRNSLVATPGGGAKTESKKSSGEKFVEKAAKDLKNAFAPKTKAKSASAGAGAGAQGSTGDNDSAKDKKDHGDK